MKLPQYSTICAELRKRPAGIRKAFYGALGLGLAGVDGEQFVEGADRPMHPKHLELAIFTERTMDEELTWPERRVRWNASPGVAAQPDWRAREDDPKATQFALESRRAWERLTGESWTETRAAAESMAAMTRKLLEHTDDDEA